MASTGVFTLLVCIITASFLFLQVSSSLNGSSYQVSLWPDGEIPYAMSRAFGRRRRMKILAAVKQWEHVTCLKFKPRTTEQNYVKFAFSKIGVCNTDLGYLGSGMQTVQLGKGCFHRSILLHEIGHVIGLHHEHKRPDRNKYIKILWDNITPSYSYAFEISRLWHPVALKFPYDYYSVMHFGATHFARKGKSIQPKNSQIRLSSGSERISVLDGRKVRAMYKCPEFPDFPRDFHWSHDGRITNGTTCIKMDEPRDPNGWDNNYLCYKNNCTKPLNITWSHSGPISGMSCTKITDQTKPNSTSWDDNYLCVPLNAPFKFKWLLRRPSPEERKNCRHLNEPRDRDWQRGYHYLCVTNRETDPIDGQWSLWSNWGACSKVCGAGFHFRIRDCSNPFPANGGKSCLGGEYERRKCNDFPCEGPPRFPKDFSYTANKNSAPSGNCLRTHDIFSYFNWYFYYFCTSTSRSNPGITWSYNGPLPGKRCTRIYNPIENRYRRGSWMKNYLCVPKESPYHFVWSLNGKIKGLPCMRWYAQRGTKGWDKTYLCNRKQ